MDLSGTIRGIRENIDETRVFCTARYGSDEKRGKPLALAVSSRGQDAGQVESINLISLR